MDISTDDESVDEEMEESLPICVVGNLTKLRKDRSKLVDVRKRLKSQLESSQRRIVELESQVAMLETRLASVTSDTSDQVTSECVKCQELQLQLDEVGERLGSGQLSFIPPDLVTVAYRG